jgi:hypothetical protein
VVGALRRRPLTCLHRALAAWATLRASGEEISFVLGVSRRGKDIVAHAWLERAGAAIGEPEDPRGRYQVAWVYPPAPRETAMPPKNADVILTELPDGTGVLLHLGTKFYYALNRTGVAAWKMLEDGEARSAADVARLLAQRFSGVRAEDARGDVEALLAELRAERLLPPGVGD